VKKNYQDLVEKTTIEIAEKLGNKQTRAIWTPIGEQNAGMNVDEVQSSRTQGGLEFELEGLRVH